MTQLMIQKRIIAANPDNLDTAFEGAKTSWAHRSVSNAYQATSSQRKQKPSSNSDAKGDSDERYELQSDEMHKPSDNAPEENEIGILILVRDGDRKQSTKGDNERDRILREEL
jgi:hypothetical protein